jgi:hypothetical protein
MDRLHGGRCSRLDKALVLAAVRVGREYRAREADFAKLLDGKSPATISISKRVGRCRNRSVRIAGFSAVSPRRSFSSKSAHLNGYRFSFAVKQFGTNANPPRTFSLPSSGVSLSESSSPSPRRLAERSESMRCDSCHTHDEARCVSIENRGAHSLLWLRSARSHAAELWLGTRAGSLLPGHEGFNQASHMGMIRRSLTLVTSGGRSINFCSQCTFDQSIRSTSNVRIPGESAEDDPRRPNRPAILEDNL